MLKAIDEGRYAERLRQSDDLGHDLGVTGVPTFIVNDRQVIVAPSRSRLSDVRSGKLANLPPDTGRVNPT